MKRSKRFNLQERIIDLARIKGTGSLSDLSLCLEISERTTKRVIKDIREKGVHIRFDRIRGSYVIDD